MSGCDASTSYMPLLQLPSCPLPESARRSADGDYRSSVDELRAGWSQRRSGVQLIAASHLAQPASQEREKLLSHRNNLRSGCALLATGRDEGERQDEGYGTEAGLMLMFFSA